jgi:hypothetical protein
MLDLRSEEIQVQSDKIRQRAYEIFVRRGCRGGHALDDWLDAEKQILIEHSIAGHRV